MFLKRLSIALCALMCFSGFVMGTNSNTAPDAKQFEEESFLMESLAVDFEPTANSPKCFEDKNGFFSIQILVPSDPSNLSYSYQIINTTTGLPADSDTKTGVTFFTNPKLAPGQYQIKVKELSSNTDIAPKTRTITPTSKIIINGSSSSPNCSGDNGQITINASGGNGGYDFYLNYGQPNQLAPTSTITNKAVFNIVNSGTYTAFVEDSKGCPGTSLDVFTVTIPEAISPFVTVGTINCPGEIGRAHV